MVHRKLESTIVEMLESFRIVAINGPRQSGKTTLQKKIAKNKDMKYYTFDEATIFDTASSDPKGFIDYISKDGLIASYVVAFANRDGKLATIVNRVAKRAVKSLVF